MTVIPKEAQTGTQQAAAEDCQLAGAINIRGLVQLPRHAVEETLQQESDGIIKLPVARCEYAIRRISYDYEEKVTRRWGENPKQGLIWKVNVTKPGSFRVISEDNGENKLQYELITLADTLLLNARGELDVMSEKEQDGTIHIEQAGPQQILVYPTVTALTSRRYKFKGLTLMPVD